MTGTVYSNENSMCAINLASASALSYSVLNRNYGNYRGGGGAI